jgi:hypothetical protein
MKRKEQKEFTTELPRSLLKTRLGFLLASQNPDFLQYRKHEQTAKDLGAFNAYYYIGFWNCQSLSNKAATAPN